jgi:hypothetical protein
VVDLVDAGLGDDVRNSDTLDQVGALQLPAQVAEGIAEELKQGTVVAPVDYRERPIRRERLGVVHG